MRTTRKPQNKIQSHVYTLTANPALDLSGHVDRLLANEKNYVHDVRRDPGGNGINAARVATRLANLSKHQNVKVVALGFLGGAAGEEIEALVRSEGINCQFTEIANATRMNVTVTNESDHQQTRLTFPGPMVSVEEQNRLLKLIQELKGPGLFVLGGSLPPGVNPSFFLNVSRAAARAQLDLIVDVPALTLKKIFGAPQLRSQNILMIKPNNIELEEFMGRSLKTERALIAAAREIIAEKRCRFVCVSRGSEGALLVSEDHAWKGIAPQIRAKGSVGAGDSMVGAMAWFWAQSGGGKTLTPEDLASGLRWGLAAGAATAMTPGTTLGEARLVKRLISKCRVERIAVKRNTNSFYADRNVSIT